MRFTDRLVYDKLYWIIKQKSTHRTKKTKTNEKKE